MKINFKIISPLLLSLTIFSCQSGNEENKTIVSTHPKLEEELERNSVDVPVSPNDTSDLYNRYRITMQEYEGSGNYAVNDLYIGRLAPLDEESHADALKYRTAINEGLKDGVNFAGQYTVVTVGCGTSCQTHYVVDRESGQVLDKVESNVGAQFSKNSRLFVVNPPDSTINYNECSYCTPQAYVFENGKFRKL
ncbi:hypothetical protein ACFSKU_03790 [Pontibacter silvestris]|uniref:Lipoprotein n=1 Tax=Pontibacter silvestris TaxID=2305183 RepID=A0ABW4WV08_9BACT|nr:hypothetical protein [Pontibacter silvestris]MCC9138016.1 hypothetical protein [Pontibacter silvestris]